MSKVGVVTPFLLIAYMYVYSFIRCLFNVFVEQHGLSSLPLMQCAKGGKGPVMCDG